MGRAVTGVVTCGGVCVGTVGPFAVDIPWWAEVEPVVEQLERTLRVPVVVLRLLSVDGADDARDGHVTYHVEALECPGELDACDFVDHDHPLRLPWARVAGIDVLLADIPGADGWDAGPHAVAEAVRRLVAAQARIERPPPDLPDRRPEALHAAVAALLDGPVGAELSAGERKATRDLQCRWEMLADCGLPDTVVHGDFHPGNWRCGNGPPVVLDFADARPDEHPPGCRTYAMVNALSEWSS